MVRRKSYIELLRIWGCIWVIFNHTCYGLRGRGDWEIGKSQVIFLTAFFLCKTAVPVFLMIAGTNLMNKEESIQKQLKRFGKYLIILVLFSVFYVKWKNPETSVLNTVVNLYRGPVTTAFWYFYMYLALLAMLPIIRKLKMAEKEYLYLFSIYFIGGMLQFTGHYLGVRQPSEFLYYFEFSKYFIIFLMGNYFGNILKKEHLNNKSIWAVWVIFIADIFISIFFFYRNFSEDLDFNFDAMYSSNFCITTTILTVCVYLLVMYYSRYLSEMVIKVVCEISSCTFGIYLLGDYLEVRFVGILNYFRGYMSEMKAVLLFDIAVFMIGFVITYTFYAVVRIVKSVSTKKGIINER